MIRTLLALTLLLTFALVNANWEGCGSGKVIKVKTANAICGLINFSGGAYFLTPSAALRDFNANPKHL